MEQSTQVIVKIAMEHFKQGRYKQAKTFYEQAAKRYGDHLFSNTIRLCDLRIKQTNFDKIAYSTPQLEETQKLLEHYYTRCQELEYQLLGRNAS